MKLKLKFLQIWKIVIAVGEADYCYLAYTVVDKNQS